MVGELLDKYQPKRANAHVSSFLSRGNLRGVNLWYECCVASVVFYVLTGGCKTVLSDVGLQVRFTLAAGHRDRCDRSSPSLLTPAASGSGGPTAETRPPGNARERQLSHATPGERCRGVTA